MPELPEVETVCRGLAPAMTGAEIVKVEQRRSDLRFPFPADFCQRLEGRRIVSIKRRAKYLLMALDSGETLLAHLGMTGRFTVALPAPAGVDQDRLGAFYHETAPAALHDHVVIHLRSGARVTYNDPRRFGFMDLVAAGQREHHKLLRDLGVEPLGDGLTSDYLAAAAAGRRTDLKAFLLDQTVIAGLGNIYVSEALHRACLSPKREAATIAGPRRLDHRRRLIGSIRSVLHDAIRAGGSTLRDYRSAGGDLGYFQHAFRVYDRADAPCPNMGCAGTIKRIVQSARATYYCPRCQR
jgi:formamidopyrimidine-DNA glycosylase